MGSGRGEGNLMKSSSFFSSISFWSVVFHHVNVTNQALTFSVSFFFGKKKMFFKISHTSTNNGQPFICVHTFAGRE